MIERFYLHSSNPAPRLRIGLLLDSRALPAWSAAAVSHIAASNFARIELVILNAGQKPRRGSNRGASNWLFEAYSRWDQVHFPLDADPLRPVDCAGLLAGIETHEVRAIAEGSCDRFPAEALDAIRRAQLDVIVRLGFHRPSGEILNAARYGVWSFRHSDPDRYRGGPAYFWELCEGNPLSGVALEVLSEKPDAGLVLAKGIYATARGVSSRRNRWRPCWAGSFYLIQKLHELHQHGWERLEARALPRQSYRGRRETYGAPGNWDMARFMARKAVRIAFNRLRGAGRNYAHWRMAVRMGQPQTLAPGRPLEMSGFHWIEPPEGHFHADPFLLDHDGKAWLFFEDFVHADKKAVIACSQLFPDGSISPRTVIEAPHHLSFPLLFRHDGCLYLVPESRGRVAIDVYRCVRFPWEWALDRPLFEGFSAVDSVLWVEDGVFFLFTTVADPCIGPARCPHLLLFHSDSLFGAWTPHPCNPICTDERFIRNAGAIFRQGDLLIRPSQDCTEGYGHSMNFRQIVTLTKTDYKEVALTELRPSWWPGLAGTHTYARSSCAEVVDGFIPQKRGVSDGH